MEGWKNEEVEGDCLLWRNVHRAAVACRCSCESDPRQKASELFMAYRHDLRAFSTVTKLEPKFSLVELADEERRGWKKERIFGWKENGVKESENSNVRLDEPLMVVFGVGDSKARDFTFSGASGLVSKANKFPVHFLASQIIYCNRSVLITGHSLNGAIAELVTKRLFECVPEAYKEKITCITFGAPSISSSPSSENPLFSNQIINIHFERDLVPRLLDIVGSGLEVRCVDERAINSDLDDLIKASRSKDSSFFGKLIESFYDNANVQKMLTSLFSNSVWDISRNSGLDKMLDLYDCKHKCRQTYWISGRQEPPTNAIEQKDLKSRLSRYDNACISRFHSMEYYLKAVGNNWWIKDKAKIGKWIIKEILMEDVTKEVEFWIYRLETSLVQAQSYYPPLHVKESESEVIFDGNWMKCVIRGGGLYFARFVKVSFHSSQGSKIGEDQTFDAASSLRVQNQSLFRSTFDTLAVSFKLPQLFDQLKFVKISIIDYFGERSENFSLHLNPQLSDFKTHGEITDGGLPAAWKFDIVSLERLSHHSPGECIQKLLFLNLVQFVKRTRLVEEVSSFTKSTLSQNENESLVENLIRLESLHRLAEEDRSKSSKADHFCTELIKSVDRWKKNWDEDAIKIFSQLEEPEEKRDDILTRQRAAIAGLLDTSIHYEDKIYKYHALLLLLLQKYKVKDSARSSLWDTESAIVNAIGPGKFGTLVEYVKITAQARKAISEHFAVGVIGGGKTGKSSLVKQLTGDNGIFTGLGKKNSTFSINEYSSTSCQEALVMDFPAFNESCQTRKSYDLSLDLCFAFVVVCDIAYSRTNALRKILGASLTNRPVLICLNKADIFLAEEYQESEGHFDGKESVEEAIEGVRCALKSADSNVRIWATSFNGSKRGLNTNVLLDAGVKTVEHLELWMLGEHIKARTGVPVYSQLHKRFETTSVLWTPDAFEANRRVITLAKCQSNVLPGDYDVELETEITPRALKFAQEFELAHVLSDRGDEGSRKLFASLSNILFGNEFFETELKEVAQVYMETPPSKRTGHREEIWAISQALGISIILVSFPRGNGDEPTIEAFQYSQGNRESILLFQFSQKKFTGLLPKPNTS